ncbi:MAG TPA: Hpt domain-containing protein [Gemmatimonadales bacterium]|nr:Hpt domain-containing protein [Gemmatimonadales bacterium]
MTAETRIDPTVINELIDLGPDTGLQLVKDLVELFNGEAPLRLGAMREGLATGNSTAIAHAAHAMRGGAGNLGAVAVGGLCTRIEQAARDGDLLAVRPMLDQLDQELEFVHGALAERLAAME